MSISTKGHLTAYVHVPCLKRLGAIKPAVNVNRSNHAPFLGTSQRILIEVGLEWYVQLYDLSGFLGNGLFTKRSFH